MEEQDFVLLKSNKSRLEEQREHIKMQAQEERTMMSTLYNASMEGCVSTLDSLIQQNSLILDKISLTTFGDTPLHVSALRGHLDFTETILRHKPQLTKELDSCRRTPLHLASAEGHKEIVQVLLQAYADACLVHDEDGRIPVHYAAMRGRTEVVRELIKAKPDSLRVLDKGDTLLHLCVTYNRLETLKVLVEEEGGISELLPSRNSDGNTILHLATIVKQVETIRYMLSIPKIIETAKNENDMGFTALDMIGHTPKDFKSLDIQVMLTDVGIKSKKSVQMDDHNPPPPSTTVNVVPEVRPSPRNCWVKFKDIVLKHQADSIEKWRQTLGIVATVIATMSFPVAINPPGGVYQQSFCMTYNETDGTLICPGEAILGIRWPTRYQIFLLCNTISFVASLSVTILIVTGVPTKNKVIMWILTIGMCFALSFLLGAYTYGLSMTTPASTWIEVRGLYTGISLLFTAVYWLIGLLLTIRFLAWVGRKCKNLIKRMISRRTRNSEIPINRCT